MASRCLSRRRDRIAVTPEITETRQTGLFRATGKREHVVERGRKPPQIAPKPRNSAFLENTTGPKKPTSKRSHKVLLEYQWLMARGRTPPYRQSFRSCPSFLFPCRLGGYKGRFDATCGRLPVRGRIGKTRQIAFVGALQTPAFCIEIRPWKAWFLQLHQQYVFAEALHDNVVLSQATPGFAPC